MAAPWPRCIAVSLYLGLLCTPVWAGPIRAGFEAAWLPAADDISGPPVDLGFAVNFFGQTFSSLFVNSNGNVTFGEPMAAFSPVPLGLIGQAVVAPFFADVDTSLGGQITYGTGQIDGNSAFAATWRDVPYHSETPLGTNDFQAVFISRPDTGTGNFDLEFNYGRVAWESGDFSGGVGGRGGSAARAGFSGGTPATTYELPGSGKPGQLLDDAPTALISTLFQAEKPGRFLFAVRDDSVTTPEPLPPSGPANPAPGPAPTPTDPFPERPDGVIGTPEPATLLLAVVGLGGIGARRFRRRN